MRLLKKIRAARLWGAALDAASKKQFTDALQKLESIEELEIGVPDPVEFGLFKGFLLYSTGQYDRALKVSEWAYDKLANSSEYSENEKNYLRCYGSVTCHFIAREVPVTAELREKLERKFQMNYDNVDLARIANRLKREFPLRDHPNWDKGSDKGLK